MSHPSFLGRPFLLFFACIVGKSVIFRKIPAIEYVGTTRLDLLDSFVTKERRRKEQQVLEHSFSNYYVYFHSCLRKQS